MHSLPSQLIKMEIEEAMNDTRTYILPDELAEYLNGLARTKALPLIAEDRQAIRLASQHVIEARQLRARVAELEAIAAQRIEGEISEGERNLVIATAKEDFAETISDRMTSIICAAGVNIEDEPDDSVLSRIWMMVTDEELEAHKKREDAALSAAKAVGGVSDSCPIERG
jgi:hypothetical protein